MGLSSFPPDQEEWLFKKLPEFYEVKGAKTKWLTMIADAFFIEFEYPKENDPIPLEKYREKKIPRWFYNSKKRKGVTVSTSHELVGEKRGKGLGALQVYARPPGARELFGQANKTAINSEAQERRKTANEGSHTHLKFWNEVLAEKWEELSSNEQAIYRTQAQAAKVASQQPPTQNMLYQNQDILQEQLYKYLQSLLGFDHGQIGNGLMHLQVAYRGREDVIESFSLLISPKDVKINQEYHKRPDYQINQGRPWAEYVLHELPLHSFPPNTTSTELVALLKVDNDGAPLLPPMASTNSQMERLAILKQYFFDSWNHHWMAQSTPGPALSWTRFTATVKDFLRAGCIPPTYTNVGLTDTDDNELQCFYQHFYQLQQRRVEEDMPQVIFRRHNQLSDILNHDSSSGTPNETSSLQGDELVNDGDSSLECDQEESIIGDDMSNTEPPPYVPSQPNFRPLNTTIGSLTDSVLVTVTTAGQEMSCPPTTFPLVGSSLPSLPSPEGNKTAASPQTTPGAVAAEATTAISGASEAGDSTTIAPGLKCSNKRKSDDTALGSPVAKRLRPRNSSSTAQTHSEPPLRRQNELLRPQSRKTTGRSTIAHDEQEIGSATTTSMSASKIQYTQHRKSGTIATVPDGEIPPKATAIAKRKPGRPPGRRKHPGWVVEELEDEDEEGDDGNDDDGEWQGFGSELM